MLSYYLYGVCVCISLMHTLGLWVKNNVRMSVNRGHFSSVLPLWIIIIVWLFLVLLLSISFCLYICSIVVLFRSRSLSLSFFPFFSLYISKVKRLSVWERMLLEYDEPFCEFCIVNDHVIRIRSAQFSTTYQYKNYLFKIQHDFETISSANRMPSQFGSVVRW